MASSKRIAIYEAVAAGKRVVTIATHDLPAVKVWLGAHGFSYKAKRSRASVELTISERK